MGRFFCGLRRYLLYDAVEGLWVVLCENREDLSVNDDVLLLDHAHELAVREALCVEGGVDLDDVEASSIALLVSSVSEGVCACV